MNNENSIALTEVMERMRLSRNYIVRRITHEIKHLESSPSKGTKVFFDAKMLRAFFKDNATFTRQTKRINIKHEIEKYKNANPDKPTFIDYKDFLGNIPDMSKIKRSELPAVPVKSFDYWDLPIIFPKEYRRGNDKDSPVVNAEICYRDMFRTGAIKIQLGSQKTMFYIPQEEKICHPPLQEAQRASVTNPDYYLVPADWEPFYKGITITKETENEVSNQSAYNYDELIPDSTPAIESQQSQKQLSLQERLNEWISFQLNNGKSLPEIGKELKETYNQTMLALGKAHIANKNVNSIR
ncbi:hypothetical protein [Selenomonas ruminantium]|uniref:hypothetical protein n=1 Tax=Selenomonas ruminantium TaxID=971 RepID=UPI0026F2F870|nr:hypothetical protein [Selenomonas ruminantium]